MLIWIYSCNIAQVLKEILQNIGIHSEESIDESINYIGE